MTTLARELLYAGDIPEGQLHFKLKVCTRDGLSMKVERTEMAGAAINQQYVVFRNAREALSWLESDTHKHAARPLFERVRKAFVSHFSEKAQ